MQGELETGLAERCKMEQNKEIREVGQVYEGRFRVALEDRIMADYASGKYENKDIIAACIVASFPHLLNKSNKPKLH